jgi:peptide/nickel transport system substrate-binding protein
MTLNDLQKLFEKKQISRREFMRAATILGLSASAVGSITAAQEPKRGGTLVVGLQGGSSTDSLDPATFASDVPYMLGNLYGNLLIETDATGSLEGGLAESWETIDGGTTWAFVLRQGVTFHNGKTMTSADVVYSLNRHRGEDSSSGAAGLMQSITDIKAAGDYAIEVTLDGPNADLPYYMSDYHLIIQPEGSVDDGIGTGPFVVEEVEHGVRYLATRNPNFFRDGRPYVDAVEVLVINDPTARTASLQTGKVHMINRVEPKAVSFLQGSKNVSIENVSGRGHYVFIMHINTNPFDAPDVQLALKYAINRQQMVDTVLQGFGSIGNDHPINAAYPLFENTLEQRDYDPEQAAFYYKKSGHSGPIILRTSEVAFGGAIEAATLYKESAAQAGINLEIVREPGDGYWSDVWNVQPFSASYWGGRPTQDQMFSIAYKSDAPWNDTRFFRSDFDEMLISARSELDNAKRAATYTQMQTMLRDEGGVIVPMFNDFIDARVTNVQGYVADPEGMLMGGRAAEFVWLDES